MATMSRSEITPDPSDGSQPVAATTNELDAQLISEAMENLDDILERHTFGFVHLDRGALIERIQRVREAALAARLILKERRSGRVES
jgi:hypothetical protein